MSTGGLFDIILLRLRELMVYVSGKPQVHMVYVTLKWTNLPLVNTLNISHSLAFLYTYTC